MKKESYRPKDPVKLDQDAMKRAAEDGLRFRREIEKRADKMARVAGSRLPVRMR